MAAQPGRWSSHRKPGTVRRAAGSATGFAGNRRYAARPGTGTRGREHREQRDGPQDHCQPYKGWPDAGAVVRGPRRSGPLDHREGQDDLQRPRGPGPRHGQQAHQQDRSAASGLRAAWTGGQQAGGGPAPAARAGRQTYAADLSPFPRAGQTAADHRVDQVEQSNGARRSLMGLSPGYLGVPSHLPTRRRGAGATPDRPAGPGSPAVSSGNRAVPPPARHLAPSPE